MHLGTIFAVFGQKKRRVVEHDRICKIPLYRRNGLSMDALILNGRVYSHAQLMHGAIPAEAHDEARKVLQFSRQWLTGQERFTIYTSGSTGTPKAIHLTR